MIAGEKPPIGMGDFEPARFSSHFPKASDEGLMTGCTRRHDSTHCKTSFLVIAFA